MRVDQLTEAHLPTVLSRLRADLDEIKNRQRAGRYNMLIGETVDGTIEAAAIAAYTQRRWRIKFTPTSAKQVYAEIIYREIVIGGTGYETTQVYADPDNQTQDDYRSWILVYDTDSSAVTLYMYFFFKCVDTGTVEVIAL